MVLRKKRFLIGGIIVFLAIGYLIYTGIAAGATSNYAVSELLEQGSPIYGENVRVSGEVLPGSVEQEAQGRILKFTVIDADGKGSLSLPVVYQGVVPDTFKAGSEVIIEGQLNSDGIFQANILMARCPSRYEPENETQPRK